MRRNQIYWSCQLAGWFGMVAIETVNYTFFIIGHFEQEIFLGHVYDALIGIGLTHLLRYFLIKTQFITRTKTSIWFSAILSTFVISLLLVVSSLFPYLFKKDSLLLFKQLTPIYIVGLIMNWMRYVGVWVIIYFMYKVLQQNNAIQKEKLTLENLAKTTELELLKLQLNPHFLFNALNSIKALVIINPEQSRDAIVKLSELLRFTLQYGKERQIPLKEEIAEVKKYLELEQMRFGQRLMVQYAIDENTISQTIPPAVVLTLAENAVKHGTAKQVKDSIIVVSAFILDDHFHVEVTNDGQYDEQLSTGIGLKHIQKRLDEVYHQQAQFSIKQIGEQVTASIKIPLS